MDFSSHLKILLQAWREETKRRAGTLIHNLHRVEETQFLPAALEVTETPPSPIGRSILWVVIAASLTALIWSFVSKIDMVATAEGRLVPEGRLRTVEATEQGVIHAIHVREGAHVRAGDLLIELDPTIANADASSANTDLAAAALTRARDNALIAYAEGHPQKFMVPPKAAPQAVEAERQLIKARIAEEQQKQAGLHEKRIGAEASLRASEAETLKLRRVLPLLQEQLDSQNELEHEGFGSRQKRLQTEQALITAQQDLNAEIAKRDETRSQIQAIDREIAETRQAFIGQAAQERTEAEAVVATRQDALQKADQRRGRQRLFAPVSGVVQEVTVTTIGEVPEVGKPLVTLVPDAEPLVVEALLMNRDAGFVHKDQGAAIKFEAYPFTRYGVLKARVEHVSPDATVDQQKGLVFPIRLKLLETRLMAEGRPATLTAGMTVTAEIVTGQRRVIDYLLSPITKTLNESLHER